MHAYSKFFATSAGLAFALSYGGLSGGVAMAQDSCEATTCYDGILQFHEAEQAGGQVETIIRGPSVTDDSYLIDNGYHDYQDVAPGHNYSFSVGEIEWYNYWRATGVIRFDLSSIPSDAQITKAEFRAFVYDECSAAASDPSQCGTFDPGEWTFVAQELRRPFSEFEVTYLEAASGDDWAIPGALSTTADRFPDIVGESSPLNSQVDGEWITMDLTDSVAAMVVGDRDNHGWVLTGPDVSHYQSRFIQLRSSQVPEGYCDERPYLHVEWVPAP